MVYEFRPAKRDGCSLLIGLAGPTGGGKTLSALKLARGLAGGDDSKIFFIDSESGRALHYAPAAEGEEGFRFHHGEITAPFSPEAYTAAIEAAEKAGAEVIVIDSASHEWAGEGGVCEMAEASAERRKKFKPEPVDWIKPKAEHKRFVNRLLRCRTHLIFCLRAHETLESFKDETGKLQWRKGDFAPICERGFMFEMTLSCLLLSDRPGVPKWLKLPGFLKSAFPEGQPVSERSGELLAAWARGQAAGPATASDAGSGADTQKPAAGTPAPSPKPGSVDDFWDRASLEIPLKDTSAEGLRAWSGRLTKAAHAAPFDIDVARLRSDNAPALAIYAKHDKAGADYLEETMSRYQTQKASTAA